MRPKRCIDKVNYRELADIKLPKRSRVTSNKATLSEQSLLYHLKVLERNEYQAKVRYIGYGSKYDEWRSADDIVDVEENDNSSKVKVFSRERLSPVAKLCLFEELACTIKPLLYSHRKQGSVCCITISFDHLHFECLVHRTIRKGTRGKTVMVYRHFQS